MKKLTLLILLTLGYLISKGQLPAYDCTTRVYQDKWEVYNHTLIVWDNGEKYLESPSACAVYGPDPLIIRRDSLNGVYPFGGGMFVKDYVTGELHTVTCDQTEVGDGYKAQFYFQNCGNPYPYEFRNGVIDTVIKQGRYGYNPAQWDTLIKYFTPADSIAFIPCSPDIYPQAITISVCHTDRYYGNKLIRITDVPDGVYKYDLDVNMPPRVFDLDPNLHKFSDYLRISGNLLTWESNFVPPTCCTDPLPGSPSNLKIKGQTILTWDPVQGATGYEVWRAAAAQAPGGWYVQSINDYRLLGTTTTTSASLPLVSGKWAYRIKAKNCNGTSGFSPQIIR